MEKPCSELRCTSLTRRKQAGSAWKVQRCLFSTAEPQDDLPSLCQSASAGHGELNLVLVPRCTSPGREERNAVSRELVVKNSRKRSRGL